MLVALAGVGAIVGLLINPTQGVAPPPDPDNLLDDGGFELSPESAVWNVIAKGAPAAPISLGQPARTGRRVARVASGSTITQDIGLGARSGRSYSASAWMRAVGGPISVHLLAATNCPQPEQAETAVTVPADRWLLVTATVTPRKGEQCSLRYQARAGGGGGTAVLIDDAALVDVLLLSASFEGTTEGWAPAERPEAVVFSSISAGPGGSALDATSVGRMVVRDGEGSVAQTLALDPSSEPLVATFTVGLRRPDAGGGGAPPATLALWLLCPDGNDNQTTQVEPGSEWQVASVELATRRSLVRPDGNGCRLRTEVYAGGTLDLDGARLTLRTA